MMLIDTHTHLYLNAFEEDRKDVVNKAISNEVTCLLLPNIDSVSIAGMLDLCAKFPDNCFPMIGLHPTSVKDNYPEELIIVDEWMERKKFVAIGETGIDLYWDKTSLEQQKVAFEHQIDLAIKYKLPIVIHSRESFEEIYSILKEKNCDDLKGVFHCFTGDIEQANKIIDMGFMLGIGGVITFKNAGLDNIIEEIDLHHILLETDSPFLAPVPFRGERNESTYIRIIAQKIAQIKNSTVEHIAEITTANAMQLFKL